MHSEEESSPGTGKPGDLFPALPGTEPGVRIVKRIVN